MVDEEKLKALLEKLMWGDPHWKGAEHDVILDSVNWTFVGDDERKLLQSVGETYGCHVCGEKIKDKPEEQVWDADHQPPVNLSLTAIKHYADQFLSYKPQTSEVRLYPQCKSCSKAQSSLVRGIKASARKGWKTLDLGQIVLIEGHDKSSHGMNNYIVTQPYSTKATATEVELVQKLGAAFGCHSCPAKYPVTDYEADHLPPATLFQYTWMVSLLKALKVEAKVFKIRPACPSCQRSQGGKVGAALKLAARYIYENDPKAVIMTPGYAKHEVM